MYPKPCGSVSHAQRIFITLIEKRIFTGTLTEWGIKYPSHVYQIALGRITTTYGVVFVLRERISPELWYYDETEELPEPVKGKFRHQSTEEGLKNIVSEETAAINRIGELIENRKLREFCSTHHVKYQDIWGCTKKRTKEDGSYGYHQRPPYRIIRTLREEIHPALWYLYPDELI
jgi:hypothetical protein